MNQEKISVGMAPDYVLTMGKTIFHHRASIEVTRLNGAMHREKLTHKSLHMLSRQLAERTKAFAPSLSSTLKWTNHQVMEAEITAPHGLLIISFHTPNELSQPDKQVLHAAFAYQFAQF